MSFTYTISQLLALKNFNKKVRAEEYEMQDSVTRLQHQVKQKDYKAKAQHQPQFTEVRLIKYCRKYVKNRQRYTRSEKRTVTKR